MFEILFQSNFSKVKCATINNITYLWNDLTFLNLCYVVHGSMTLQEKMNIHKQ